MSFFATEAYARQAGCLTKFSHLSHQKQLHPAATTSRPEQQQAAESAVQHQAQQQHKALVRIELQSQQQHPLDPRAGDALVLTDYDVIDNKTNNSSSSIPIYIQKHQRYMMNDIFHREDERLKTFDTWPLHWLDKHQLAQTGMFYTGEDDKVKCYFCEVEIGRWEHSDHPVSEHLRWFPNCPLLRRRTTNNVPIDAEALDSVLPPVSYDICGANDAIESTPLSGNDSVSATTTYYPDYPEYAIEAARLRSFAEWPRHMKQKPEQLAEAGFFYIGTGDRVKCFSCGGGLKDWADDDEPWEQHALWMSKCRFLKLIKGQNYISNVLAKQQKLINDVKQQKQQQLPSHQNSIDNYQSNNSDTVMTIKMQLLDKNSSHKLGAATTVATAVPAVVSAAIDKTPANQSSTFCHNEQEIAKRTNSNMSGGCILEEKLCKICYADEYNTAFLPCGHVVACAKCASSVTKCPLCRKPFTDVMRVYFS